MSEIAIRVENLGKQYQIGKREQHNTLRDTLSHVVRTPFQRSRASETSNSESTIWSLKDVSFEVKQGEVVGIIGRNGAGKSTLLKILSRITDPTEGHIRIRGRVASLLEVGTGFHGELTGRENIYLNGAILGMKRAEIARKFDEIVAFAEVEKFIDTPVKHYSSGMYLRLAFAVSAHLEPEILLVDEVLAVGDAAFQKKCLGKMGDVAREGRTVLFVSHNMTAVSMLCPRVILLADGFLKRQGVTNEVLTEYLNLTSENRSEILWNDPTTAPGNDQVRLHAVRIISGDETKLDVDIDREVSIEIDFYNLVPSNCLFTNIQLLDNTGMVVLESANTPGANLLPEKWFYELHPVGNFRSTCTLPSNFLNEGIYYVSVLVATCVPPVVQAEAHQVISFRVFDTGFMRTPGLNGPWKGVIRTRLAWQTEYLQKSD